MFKNVRTVFKIKKFKIDIYVICIDKGCVQIEWETYKSNSE